MTTDALRHLDAEAWLARRLGNFGHVFQGVTDRETRKQRIRDAIREGGLEMVIAGRNPEGRPDTFAEVFQRLYGAAL